MSLLFSGTIADLEAAELPKIGETIWTSPKAYLYAAMSSKWRAKIGAATNPIGRVRQVFDHWGDVQQVFVIKPRAKWRIAERQLVDAMDGYQVRGWMCSESSQEWFKLPRPIYGALRQCFLNGLSDEAMDSFRSSIKKKTYQHPMKTVIGTCSLCGGQVTTPHIWHGVNPPIPTCEQCNAIADNHGPVIPMKPPQRRYEFKYGPEDTATFPTP